MCNHLHNNHHHHHGLWPLTDPSWPMAYDYEYYYHHSDQLIKAILYPKMTIELISPMKNNRFQMKNPPYHFLGITLM